jgi:hypothetical protein
MLDPASEAWSIGRLRLDYTLEYRKLVMFNPAFPEASRDHAILWLEVVEEI